MCLAEAGAMVGNKGAVSKKAQGTIHPTGESKRFLAGRTWPEVATRYIDIMSEFANC